MQVSGWQELLCRSVDGRNFYVGQWLLLCGSVDDRNFYTVVCEPLHRCRKIFELKTFHLLTGRTIGHELRETVNKCHCQSITLTLRAAGPGRHLQYSLSRC